MTQTIVRLVYGYSISRHTFMNEFTPYADTCVALVGTDTTCKKCPLATSFGCFLNQRPLYISLFRRYLTKHYPELLI